MAGDATHCQNNGKLKFDDKLPNKSLGIYVYTGELEYQLLTGHLSSSTLLISIHLVNNSTTFVMYYFLQYSEQQIDGKNSAVVKSLALMVLVIQSYEDTSTAYEMIRNELVTEVYI